MKSSPYRKRYILVHIENLPSRLKSVETSLYRVFRAKRKYVEGDYAVFRTNQFYKDQFIEYVRNEMEGAETLVTSGSMKKCKAAISARSSENILKAKA